MVNLCGSALSISLGNRGLTLLEVLVSMALLSLVVLGFAGYSTVAIQGAAASRNMTTAISLAQEKLEEVRLGGYRHDLSASESVTEPYGSIPHAPLHSRTVVVDPDRPAPGVQTITVVVRWGQDAHSVELVTLRGE